MDGGIRSDVRYEMLRENDEEVIEGTDAAEGMPIPVIVSVMPNFTPPALPTPEYTQLENTQQALLTSKIPEPPSYDVATKLPTYEEAEISKVEEQEQQQQEVSETTAAEQVEIPLGTDGIFVCTFMIAFLFNWIGLLAAVCVSQTIAARFGALAGFGLSLVKWVIIFKHNKWASGMADGDSWVWWLLIILGFIIFFRGCLHYISLKHQWRRLQTDVRAVSYFYL